LIILKFKIRIFGATPQILVLIPALGRHRMTATFICRHQHPFLCTCQSVRFHGSNESAKVFRHCSYSLPMLLLLLLLLRIVIRLHVIPDIFLASMRQTTNGNASAISIRLASRNLPDDSLFSRSLIYELLWNWTIIPPTQPVHFTVMCIVLDSPNLSYAAAVTSTADLLRPPTEWRNYR